MMASGSIMRGPSICPLRVISARIGSAASRVPSRHPNRVDWPLSHAIALEVVAYAVLDCLCRRDIGIAAGFVALLELGKPASIKRAREIRIEPKGRAIIVDLRSNPACLQVDQATRVIRRGAARIRLQRLVAILQRCLECTEDSS